MVFCAEKWCAKAKGRPSRPASRALNPEEAERYELSPMEEEFTASWTNNIVHGTADEVRSGLDDLHKRTGADELMLTSHAHRGELRLRSYELIADAYGLPTA